jgi:hypothetical protein
MNARAAVLTSRIAGVVAIAFGLLTIASGGRALFGGEVARAAVGAAVPFVLWFNFVAGFAYVVAGVGILRRLRWAFPLSLAIAAATLVVAAAFALHVASGGAYEMRTVGAMTFRLLAWSLLAVVARSVATAGQAPA